MRQALLDERGAAVMQGRVHHPVALDVAQDLGGRANRRHRQLDAIVPDVGSPGRGNVLVADQQPLVSARLDAGALQFFAELRLEAFSREIGSSH